MQKVDKTFNTTRINRLEVINEASDCGTNALIVADRLRKSDTCLKNGPFNSLKLVRI